MMQEGNLHVECHTVKKNININQINGAQAQLKINMTGENEKNLMMMSVVSISTEIELDRNIP